MSPLLFAYGSNLSVAEMAEFAPEARFAGIARLPGFALELRRRSIRWGGGAADIVEREGEEVWGVLYEVHDLDALDAKEGTGFAYRRRELDVMTDQGERQAVAYEVIDKEPKEVAPTREYSELLLSGARERGLPDAYIAVLERRLGSAT